MGIRGDIVSQAWAIVLSLCLATGCQCHQSLEQGQTSPLPEQHSAGALEGLCRSPASENSPRFWPAEHIMAGSVAESVSRVKMCTGYPKARRISYQGVGGRSQLCPCIMLALPPACSSMDVSAEKPFSPVTPWPPFPTALQFAEVGWLHLTHATSLGCLQSL